MVKGLCTFSLDIEVIKSLKKIKNKSKLINSYLIKYLKKRRDETTKDIYN